LRGGASGFGLILSTRSTVRITWLEFLVGCLATFRMALLISKEEGPAEAAKKVREAAPPGWIKRGFYCQWCQTFWWGLIAALFFTLTGRLTWTDLIIYWLAFSAGAIALNQTFTKG
jgi:hypothetical protein